MRASICMGHNVLVRHLLSTCVLQHACMPFSPYSDIAQGFLGCAGAMQAFEALGITLDDEVEVRRVEPAAYRVWFAEGGCQLDLLCDEDSMAKQLEAMEVGAGGR
jgi:hypothetical protein